jgi:hypothetical protein
MEPSKNNQQPQAPTGNDDPEIQITKPQAAPTQNPPVASPLPEQKAAQAHFVSGSQLAEQSANRKQRRAGQFVVLMASVAVVIIIIVILLVAKYGSTLPDLLTGKLTTTNYSNAGINYQLSFFRGSTSHNAQSLGWMTEGGKESIPASQVLVSPVLGKYGTGVALIIDPIPSNKQPLLPDGECSTHTNMISIFSVHMNQGGSTAVVCGEKTNKNTQIAYIFQFVQRGVTYDGFILLPYDFQEVASNPTDAKAFLSYANLAPYNDELKAIISSITVK